MKLKPAFFGSISILGIAAGALLITFAASDDSATAVYHPRVRNLDQTFIKNTQGIAGAIEFYVERRKNIKTGRIEVADMIKAEREVANFSKLQKQAALGLNWKEMGPDNVGGRTRAILIDKFNPSKMWAGGVSGGLFVSYTSGYSWFPVNDKMNTLSIASICQSKDGDIYVGTGENFTGTDGQGTMYTPGFLGRGVFKSTNGGASFDSLLFTVPVANNSGTAWAFVSRLAADPFDNNLIYAATNRGLHYTTNGGDTWTNAICLNPPTCSSMNVGNFQDVKVGSNGAVLASNGGTAYLKKAGAAEFVNISSNFGSAGRIEFAIAPSNPSYMYAVLGTNSGYMGGLYQSKDGGDTWINVVPSGKTGLFNGQADYDMALAVYPNDPEHIIVGGVELYGWSGKYNTWDPIALTQSYAQGLYVHPDKHAIVFHPNYNGSSIRTLYIGSDGGIAGSFDGGKSYVELNTGYNVTQFYSMGVSREGWVAGGTQDNGNPFIDFTGNTKKSEVYNLPSGDGGYMQFSIINPGAFFWESQGGDANRSPEKGAGASSFFAPIMCQGPCDLGTNEGPWVTPLLIWESFNDLAGTDSVTFTADQDYNAGSTIFLESKNNDFPFEYVTPVPLSVNDVVTVQDIVQNKFITSTYSGTWMCKNVLDFSIEPAWWYKLSAKSGGTCAAISSDGDIVYIGYGTQVYRISGLLGIVPGDEHTGIKLNPAIPPSVSEKQIYTSSQYVTGIGVDPNNAENVVLTLGNYGNTKHVYVSSTAASTTGNGSFTSIQGNLPAMPCYDAIIEMNDSNRIIVGTEYGMWATDNAWDTPANVVWSNENNNFPRVPTFLVVQQTMANNSCTGVKVSGNIYAATHGRGIWRCDNYKAAEDLSECELPIGVHEGSGTVHGELNIYPNPVANGEAATVAYTLDNLANVQVSLYDLSGKELRYFLLNRQPGGKHTLDMDCMDLTAGTYLVSITTNGVRTTKRLVVL